MANAAPLDNPLEPTMSALVALLLEPGEAHHIADAARLDLPARQLLIGVFTQLVSGTLTQVASTQEIGYEDALALLVQLVRSSVVAEVPTDL